MALRHRPGSASVRIIAEKQLPRGLIALLLVLAFACRALIPGGYMPVAAPQGAGLVLSWCTPQGVVAAPLPPELQSAAGHQPGDDDPAPHHPSSTDLCAFALTLGGGGLPAAEFPPAPAQAWPIAPAIPARVLAEFTTHRLAAPPPPAQAPPLSA
ncbi:hypothetical protein GRI97_17230 [Altererythrobacter xixiisoli]|uniref:DUF2946 domain-containing protein n=1 Tax=Croceibacterium xixiisoli TaxID=1476466 RepID=A0A6I4TX46_9SPHN|nr:hypothetical protein [Croceibacterium xixiisoli]MXP00736.1 hypothetical protein [Croceibacterium xixiisoli]